MQTYLNCPLNVGKLKTGRTFCIAQRLFVKFLSGFEKRQIVRACTRPDVDCVYSPILDKFLPDPITTCKMEDKTLRKAQDFLLDVEGPLAMIYELVSQARENPEKLDLHLVL